MLPNRPYMTSPAVDVSSYSSLCAQADPSPCPHHGELKVVAFPGQPARADDLSLDREEAAAAAALRPVQRERLIEPLEVVEQKDHELSPAERRMLDVLGYVED